MTNEHHSLELLSLSLLEVRHSGGKKARNWLKKKKTHRGYKQVTENKRG